LIARYYNENDESRMAIFYELVEHFYNRGNFGPEPEEKITASEVLRKFSLLGTTFYAITLMRIHYQFKNAELNKVIDDYLQLAKHYGDLLLNECFCFAKGEEFEDKKLLDDLENRVFEIVEAVNVQ
jgi:hypothetical protein